VLPPRAHPQADLTPLGSRQPTLLFDNPTALHLGLPLTDLEAGDPPYNPYARDPQDNGLRESRTALGQEDLEVATRHPSFVSAEIPEELLLRANSATSAQPGSQHGPRPRSPQRAALLAAAAAVAAASVVPAAGGGSPARSPRASALVATRSASMTDHPSIHPSIHHHPSMTASGLQPSIHASMTASGLQPSRSLRVLRSATLSVAVAPHDAGALGPRPLPRSGSLTSGAGIISLGVRRSPESPQAADAAAPPRSPSRAEPRAVVPTSEGRLGLEPGWLGPPPPEPLLRSATGPRVLPVAAGSGSFSSGRPVRPGQLAPAGSPPPQPPHAPGAASTKGGSGGGAPPRSRLGRSSSTDGAGPPPALPLPGAGAQPSNADGSPAASAGPLPLLLRMLSRSPHSGPPSPTASSPGLPPHAAPPNSPLRGAIGGAGAPLALWRSLQTSLPRQLADVPEGDRSPSETSPTGTGPAAAPPSAGSPRDASASGRSAALAASTPSRMARTAAWLWGWLGRGKGRLPVAAIAAPPQQTQEAEGAGGGAPGSTPFLAAGIAVAALRQAAVADETPERLVLPPALDSRDSPAGLAASASQEDLARASAGQLVAAAPTLGGLASAPPPQSRFSAMGKAAPAPLAAAPALSAAIAALASFAPPLAPPAGASPSPGDLAAAWEEADREPHGLWEAALPAPAAAEPEPGGPARAAEAHTDSAAAAAAANGSDEEAARSGPDEDGGADPRPKGAAALEREADPAPALAEPQPARVAALERANDPAPASAEPQPQPAVSSFNAAPTTGAPAEPPRALPLPPQLLGGLGVRQARATLLAPLGGVTAPPSAGQLPALPPPSSLPTPVDAGAPLQWLGSGSGGLQPAPARSAAAPAAVSPSLAGPIGGQGASATNEQALEEDVAADRVRLERGGAVGGLELGRPGSFRRQRSHVGHASREASLSLPSLRAHSSSTAASAAEVAAAAACVSPRGGAGGPVEAGPPASSLLPALMSLRMASARALVRPAVPSPDQAEDPEAAGSFAASPSAPHAERRKERKKERSVY
jgi:hypothetical protein